MNKNRYIFYPSHFFPYKNHRMLLTAFGMFKSRFPEDNIDLVFAGALNATVEDLKIAVKKMGLSKHIHFFGYLPSQKIEDLWKNCEFIVFPSMYEYFTPCQILKAMYLGKPVACSNLDSIRAIAKDSAIYFDPKNPSDIVTCIHDMTSHPENALGLIHKGRKIVNCLMKSDKDKPIMYSCWDMFDDYQKVPTCISHIYEDGWTGGEFKIFFESSDKNRILQLRLEAPSFLPAKKVSIEFYTVNGKPMTYKLSRGNELTIRYTLPNSHGYINVLINQVFNPFDTIIGSTDIRYLGLLFKSCEIISKNEKDVNISIKNQ